MTKKKRQVIKKGLSSLVTMTLLVTTMLPVSDIAASSNPAATVTQGIMPMATTEDAFSRSIHMKMENNLRDSALPLIDYTPFGTMTYATGHDGQALSIKNPVKKLSEPRVSLGNINYGADQDFTIAFWFKGDVKKQAQYSTILANKDYSHWYNPGWMFVFQPSYTNNVSGPMELTFNYSTLGSPTGVSNKIFEPLTGSSDGEWHHVAASVTRGKNVEMFVDGKSISTVSLPALGQLKTTIDAGLPTMIGASGTGEQEGKTDFLMDDLFIVPQAMTAAEVSQLMTERVNESGLADSVLALNFNGNVNDKSANPREVIAVNDPEYTIGRIGKAIHFQNSDADASAVKYVDAGNIEYGTNDFSVGYWLKLNQANGVNETASIISNTVSGQVGWSLGIDANKDLKWSFKTDDATSVLKETIAIPQDKKWHHYGVVIDRVNQKAKFFRDGLFISETALTGLNGSVNAVAHTTKIGADGDGSFNASLLDMMVDEFYVFNTALTNEEVRALYDIAPPISSMQMEGALDLIGAEHTLENGAVRMSVNTRFTNKTAQYNTLDMTVEYDPSKFDFMKAYSQENKEVVKVVEVKDGKIKLQISGLTHKTIANPSEYRESRIAILDFVTKVDSGTSSISIAEAQFSNANTGMNTENSVDFRLGKVDITIHGKDQNDLNKDGLITIGDIALGLAQHQEVDQLLPLAEMSKITPYKRVLLIGLDGSGNIIKGYDNPYWTDPTKPSTDAGNLLKIPFLRSLAEGGAASYDVRATMPSSSTPNWVSMLTGVPFAEHEVDNWNTATNQYSSSSMFMDGHPLGTIYRTLSDESPQRRSALFSVWFDAIYGHVEQSVGAELVRGANGEDINTLNNTLDYIRSGKLKDTDFIQVTFDEIDAALHSSGFGSKKFYDNFNTTDGRVKQLIEAIQAEGLLEDTLILISADHGGGKVQPDGSIQNWTNHGYDNPSSTTSFIIANGRTVATEQYSEKLLHGGNTYDIYGIALSALGKSDLGLRNSVVPEGMFLKQTEMNNKNNANLTLNSELDGSSQKYVLAGSQLPVGAKAIELLINGMTVNDVNIEPSQSDVQVLFKEMKDGKLRTILTSEQGFVSVSPIAVFKTPKSGKLALEQAMIANGTGYETMPNLINGDKPDEEVKDEFDVIRMKQFVKLTGGDGFNPLDPDISANIKAMSEEVSNSSLTGYWDTMNKTANRTYLWNDLPSTTISTQVSSHYIRLKQMALAYATIGSPLYHNDMLREDIIEGLEWTYTNRYNEAKSEYDNWWDWEIGTPRLVNDTIVLMYDELSPALISKYIRAVDRFVPNPSKRTVSGVTETAGNLMNKSFIVTLRGVIGKSSEKMIQGRDSMAPAYLYVNSGDGFYEDGSFIQHTYIAYTGGYGEDLIGRVADLFYLLKDSEWDIIDPNADNVYRWVEEGFEPVIYKGAIMDNLRGRGISRETSNDHTIGRIIILNLLQLAEGAPAEQALKMKQMIKEWIISDTTFDNYYVGASMSEMVLIKKLLNDDSIVPRGELVGHYQYAGMDRAVHLRDEFGFGISMFSPRIAAFEYGNGENHKGWFTGVGMTTLYNKDLEQFSDNYWGTVNMYRLPGITTDGSGSGTPTDWKSYPNPNTWVGGSSIDNLHGSVGMQFSLSQNTGSPLEGKKSWFMFGDQIVALGSNIKNTNANLVETIVENRKLNESGNNKLTVNGSEKPSSLGWAEKMSNVQWAHLAGTVEGSDIGYYFPENATISGLREARTADWKQVNKNNSTTPVTENYLSLAFDHGKTPTNANYSYVILPNKDAAATASYAAKPTIKIIENTAEAHAAMDTSLQAVGVNFWNDAVKSVNVDGHPFITSNKKASVTTIEQDGQIRIGVSDPTKANKGTIQIEVNRSATGVISLDPAITVTQLSPTIQMTVNTAAAFGETFTAQFNLEDPEPAEAPVLISAENKASQIVLKWGATNGATGYKVKYGTEAGNYSDSIDITSIGVMNEYAIKGLMIGKEYYFVVVAYNSLGESALSNELSATPLPKVSLLRILDLKLDGSLTDSSSKQNNGSATGTVQYVNGETKGQAIDLNNGYITLDANKLKLGADQNFTVAFWMKSGNQGSADTTFISNKDWASGANQGWVIGMDKGNLTWNFKGSNSARVDLKPTVATVGDDKWHHIAISHDRTGNAVIYVDNKVIKTISITGAGNIDTTLALNIGADGKGAYRYKGLLDDIQIYSSALSSVEISALYESHFAEEVDRSTLQQLMNMTKAIYDAAVEGTEAGHYPVGSKKVLNDVYEWAQIVMNDNEAIVEEVSAVQNVLTRALQDFRNSVIVKPIVGPYAELSGVSSIQSDMTFDVTYQLGNIDMDNGIYGQQLTFTYDEEQVELLSVESVREGIQIYSETLTSGKVHILAVSLGEDNVVKDDAVLLKLQFKAKSASGVTSITLSQATISGADGIEIKLDTVIHNVIITNVEMVALDALIVNAQNKHDEAIEGTSTGQYPHGAKAKLQEAIDVAKVVAENANATNEQIEEAIAALNEALQTFITSIKVGIPGDVNDNGQVTIGDLALIAKYYGKKVGDANWNEAKFADVTGDGKVDIEDLALMAKLIFE
ncbi:polysaccharide lyase family 8 super-sandwich domain-containing protein [Paenibacillus endoradicis]|uniref:polysaccharide lyase family 8 super-sandwich domain-containing protein n=1 Tax=Paenibacillus endoradicis TaxID=2972487 RepID=UPI002158AFDB|nr:polysaccharide lyase family 8 super-sandwich domain-containing protein [Paenibacillus endoradicis]MCR8660416.1 alkaline phosphatase family protein [Paenibacillus endoradicis]